MATFSLTGMLQMIPSWTDGSATTGTTLNVPLKLTNGTTADKADGFWQKTLTLNAEESHSIDLYNLPLSVFTATVSVALDKVKALLFYNSSTITTFSVGGDPANRWEGFTGGDWVVHPGGIVLVTAPKVGLQVTGSSKVLEILNEDTIETLAATTTNASTAVTALSSTSALRVGMIVAGTGIPAGAKVATITSGTAITLTAAATATGTSVSLTFQNPPASLQVIAIGVLD
jgi:hypothetical protein